MSQNKQIEIANSIGKLVAGVIKMNMDKTTKFCYKDTYGRGVGKIPRNCPDGYNSRATGCYQRGFSQGSSGGNRSGMGTR